MKKKSAKIISPNTSALVKFRETKPMMSSNRTIVSVLKPAINVANWIVESMSFFSQLFFFIFEYFVYENKYTVCTNFETTE